MTAPTLELHDESELRQDLAQRAESKFVFRRHDVPTLRAALRRGATPIAYAGPVSVVRSLYFDDFQLGTCKANLAGVGIRNKLRVRWYDAELPDGDAWFEIKWRHNQATGKHRFRVPDGPALKKLPLHEWPHALRRGAPERLLGVLEKMLQPVVVVEYRREHFALNDARFTLDYNLCFYPALGQQRLRLRFGERLPGVALIECKLPLNSDRNELRLLRPLGARPERFSKYVTACLRLGYAPDS